MKRSERYYRNARNAALQSAATFMFSIAAACWVPGAMIDNQQGASPVWLLSLVVIATASATWACIAARESFRLYKLGCSEQRFEFRREVRPRI